MAQFPTTVDHVELADVLESMHVKDLLEYTGPLNFYKVRWLISQWTTQRGKLSGVFKSFVYEKSLYIVRVK